MSKSNAMIMKSILAVLMVMAVTLNVALTQDCKPENDPEEVSMEYKTHRSDIYAYGYPRSRVRDSRFPNQELYVVDFEVRCVFKGGPLQEMIKIHNVGSVDANCVKSEFAVDTPIMIFLDREGGKLVPKFSEDPGTEEYMNEAPIICGVTIDYPIGYSADNNKESCPADYDYDCTPATDDPDHVDGAMEESNDGRSDVGSQGEGHADSQDKTQAGDQGLTGESKSSQINDGEIEGSGVTQSNPNSAVSCRISWVMSLATFALVFYLFL